MQKPVVSPLLLFTGLQEEMSPVATYVAFFGKQDPPQREEVGELDDLAAGTIDFCCCRRESVEE